MRDKENSKIVMAKSSSGIIKLDKVFLLGKHITKNSILDGMLHSFLVCQANHLLYTLLPIHTYIISKNAEKIFHFV